MKQPKILSTNLSAFPPSRFSDWLAVAEFFEGLSAEIRQRGEIGDVPADIHMTEFFRAQSSLKHVAQILKNET